MAIWQYVVRAVPRAALEEDQGGIPVRLDDLDDERIWAHAIDAERVMTALDALLPRSEGWTDEIDFWGEEDGHDAQLASTDQQIHSLMLRIDARSGGSAMITKLARFGRLLDLVFWEPATKRVVRASGSALGQALLESRASRFVEDPEEFLNGLGAGQDELVN